MMFSGVFIVNYNSHIFLVFLDRRQRGPVRWGLLVIIGWLVGWERSFLRNSSKDFSDFFHEI